MQQQMTEEDDPFFYNTSIDPQPNKYQMYKSWIWLFSIKNINHLKSLWLLTLIMKLPKKYNESQSIESSWVSFFLLKNVYIKP